MMRKEALVPVSERVRIFLRNVRKKHHETGDRIAERDAFGPIR
jgi:hypothetical protein